MSDETDDDADPQEAAFLEAIAASPDDLSLRLVHADYLQTRGGHDERGELIAVQHARDARPHDIALAQRERELSEDLARSIFGVTTPIALEWAHGFVDTVTVKRPISDQDIDLCRRRSELRFVRSLRSGRSHNDRAEEIAALCTRTLRRFEVGTSVTHGQYSSESVARVGQCTKLEELLIYGCYALSGELYLGQKQPRMPWCVRKDIPSLRWLGLHGRAGAPIREIINEDPRYKIEGLLLHCTEQADAYGRNIQLDDVGAILDSGACPSLRSIALVADTSMTEGFLERLARSPLLPQLTTLAIGVAHLTTQRTLRVLEKHASAFRHLRFDVAFTEIDMATSVADALRTLQMRPEDAVPIYRARIRQAPNDPRAGVGLGLAFVDLGKHTDAIAAFEAARESAGIQTPADAWFGEHLAYLGLDRMDDAIKSLTRAVEIDFRNTGYWTILADLLDRVGRSDEAKDARRRSIEASRSPF